MTAVATIPSAHSIIQVVNEANLNKIESFLNDTAYREAIENSSTYNSRLCRERRLRMPFLDSQTGVAQNHSALFMCSRERMPGLLHGQIYTYPSKRWRKKRRQYLMHYLHPKRGVRGDIDDGVEGADGIIAGMNDDSKESAALKDEHSKDGWYYDEQDMLDMDAFEEPDPDSDYDYEESYSSKRKRRRHRGSGHHPARSHPPATDSPGTKRTKGGGRGRKKANYDVTDSDKPFVCDRGTRRGRQSTTASSSTSSPSPVASTTPAAGAPPQPQQQQQQLPPAVQTSAAPASPTVSAPKEDQHQQQQQNQHQHQPQHQMPVTSPGTISSSPSSLRPDIIASGIGTGGGMGLIGGGGGGAASTGVMGGNLPAPGQVLDKKSGKAVQPSPYCDFCLGDARENKKTGGSEELVSCSDCGRSGKTETLEKIQKRKYTRRANHY